MARRIEEHLFFENIPGASVRFANFSGVEIPPYNPAGKRNFSIDILDEELAKKLSKDGWNIKFSEPNEDGVAYPPRLTVQVGYKIEQLKPRVMMEQGGNKVYLDEHTIGDLDAMEIIRVKAIELRPYNWDNGQSAGVTAYLVAMRVEVARDMFCD